jgi:hypothetical protein
MKNLRWLFFVIILFNPHFAGSRDSISYPLESPADCIISREPRFPSANKILDDHALKDKDKCLNCHVMSGGTARQLYPAFTPFALFFLYGLYRLFKRIVDNGL